jgi:hypothetical protein
MRQIIFFGVIFVFLYGCGDTDNQNAKYLKSIEEKNNQLGREQWKKDTLKNSDTTRYVAPSQLESNPPTTTTKP